jgi:hypothetical protein
MKETKAWCMTVEDKQPHVFKSRMDFIYTDVLSIFDDDIDANDYSEIIKHLLVAADRYAMDRLKLLCASILVEHLCVETVANTLALADQHNCKSLKDICIEFMASLDMMRAVVATQDYANLKRTCPSIYRFGTQHGTQHGLLARPMGRTTRQAPCPCRHGTKGNAVHGPPAWPMTRHGHSMARGPARWTAQRLAQAPSRPAPIPPLPRHIKASTNPNWLTLIHSPTPTAAALASRLSLSLTHSLSQI